MKDDQSDKSDSENVINKAGTVMFTGAAIGAGVAAAMVPVLMLGAFKAAYSPNAPLPFFATPILNTFVDNTLQALLIVGGSCLLLGVAPPALLYTYVFGETADMNGPEGLSMFTLAATTGAAAGLAGYGAYRLFRNTNANDAASNEPAAEKSVNQQNNI